MNALEKEIKELAVKHAKKSNHTYTQVDDFQPHQWVLDAMIELAELQSVQRLAELEILEKKLPIFFAIWLDCDGYPMIEKFTDNNFLNYDKIYDYWLNNVYGK